ncbi:interactor of constitutive active ROPs protein [Rhynchospora pubera]|uniref:Interactor of constitutive active ROPs protein n=1 Tax=Rhynchospora pubera TaxID=906938 RepID=A0AAV8CGS6_9POAL|nr:interactor of constitutive active ROPs protein [Rhynchospora pubera]
MNQTAAAASGAGSPSEHRISDEVMAVLPTDPYEQLDLARRITSLAIASRVSRLETETLTLKQKLSEKDSLLAELQGQVSQVNRAREETEARLRVAQEENVKLAKERDTLAQSSKKLSRDLAKLETFKRQLMQSLNDENSPQQETVDIRTCDQSIAKVSSWKDGITLTHSVSNLRSTDNENVTQEAARPNTQQFPVTRVAPRLTPGATPKITSTAGSPRAYSAAVSPKMTSGATSPTSKPQYKGPTVSLSPWIPSSKQSSAANSPPRNRNLPGRTPRIDGKEFFRQARSRLSYEQFAAFLANIKELNAHQQSRDETLKKAEEIFGPQNKDLFSSFQNLLSCNMA